MLITEQNRQVWLDFYDAAIKFRDMQPWTWMQETDLFGVQDPVTGETGYCCIMGEAGVHLSMAVYMGASGLNSFFNLLESETEQDAHINGIKQQCLMVSFEDRDMISPENMKRIKELGLKFKGRRQWIQAQEYQPGRLPWYITDVQAQYLTLALQQAMEVATRFKDDPDVLGDEVNMLLRTATQVDGQWQWKDRYQPAPEWEEAPMVEADPDLVARAKTTLKTVEGAILFAVNYMMQPVQEAPDQQPYFPQIALWIDYQNGMIISSLLIGPDDDLQGWFFDSLHDLLGAIPMQIVVPNEMTCDMIESICEALDIELILAPEEPIFEEVFQIIDQSSDYNN